MKNLKVPLMKQKTEISCGITALRMVLNYLGKNVSSKKIIKKVGGLKKDGVSTISLAEFANNVGFETEIYSFNNKLSKGKAKIKKPSKSTIIKFLRKNLPIILAVNSSILYNEKKSDKGHFIVITNYEKRKFWYNDPYNGKQHKIKEKYLISALNKNALNSSAYLLTLKKQ